MRTRATARFAGALDALLGGALLSAFWAAGEGVARLLPASPLPGSLWGMLGLFGALSAGWLPERRVRSAASFLVRWLGLLFVPVGVGVVAYAELVARFAVAIGAAIVLGSLVTLLASGFAAAWLAGSRRRSRSDRPPSDRDRIEPDGTVDRERPR